MRQRLIVIAALAILVLATTAPALAGEAIPVRGTYDGEDFNEVVVDSLPTSGEPGLLVDLQVVTNQGSVTATIEVPFSGFAFHPDSDGGATFGGSGMWDFGAGNVLHSQISGVFSSNSGIVAITARTIGGDGIYADATGSIHIFQVGPEQSAFTPLGGFIAGVINLN